MTSAAKKPQQAVQFQLPPLPYAEDALAPVISAETLSFHYGKHHKAYVDNLLKLVAGTELAEQPLEAVIKAVVGKPDKVGVFNNAAQIWNHTFYWHSLSPKGGKEPTGKLADAIDKAFGSFEKFKEEFAKSAAGNFGSGWTWLVQRPDGTLGIVNTSNAATPITGSDKALLTVDVWEHAYYIDYRNLRPKFVETFLDKLVNWEFAQANFA